MMKLKTIISIFSLILFVSCSSYKFIYIPVTEYENIDKLNRINAKNIKFNEIYLTFTNTYENHKIKLYENDTIKFDSYITSSKNGILGIAKAFKVNKDSEIVIYFQDIQKPLKITKEQMKDYKFIYIEKNKQKVLVEFNNGTKNFNGKMYLD